MTVSDLMAGDRRAHYTHPPRPEWVRRINEEGAVLGDGVVPLDAASLLATAMTNTGLSDFGDDDPQDHWREHFALLLRAIEQEADLNLLGRLLTRADLLMYLQARLQATDWFRRFPQIADEVITKPVFIVGLPRSGTTILHEVLSQDRQFRIVKKWEALFPCPPPQERSYHSDPRIARADAFIKIQDRISPEWRSMHAVAGDLPVECIEFTTACFLSEMFTASFQIPSYQAHLQAADIREMYRWHRRMLQLLQWRFRRPHWLFKGCNHEPYIPQLLETYPDARIIYTHRDPIRAVASVVSVQGTIFGFRTDNPFSTHSYDNWLMMDSVAKMLEQRMRWVGDGTIPAGQVTHLRFADFCAQPLAAIQRCYADLGLTLSDAAQRAMHDYLQQKPKGVFGVHAYAADNDASANTERRLFADYQRFFSVPNE
jgi:Sulfotransferase family